MASVINTNVASLNAQRNLSMSQSSLNTSIQRLSSGLRVNSSKDDAAGLGIATRMDAQVRGMTVAQRNANDGVSMLQVADGALSTITDALQRMRELAVQSANGTNGTGDQANLDAEYQKLSGEITRIAGATKFNNVAVFSASATAIQVGANSGETISFTVGAVTTVAGAVSTTAGANTALGAIDTALDTINTQRATLGAAQNQLGYAISNLQTGVENQSAAKSRIMDADFAAETANMTRGQILQQAGTAMVAQANSLPNSVLKLLQ